MADDISSYKNCKKMAQSLGALTATAFGCASVYGKRIEIGPDKMSVEEGFELVNWNFHMNGTHPALPSPEFDLGAVDGFFSGS